MPISQRKLEANRKNAKRTGASQPLCATNMTSTGPRTEAGCEAVSQNRTTHGLCGSFRVLACESQSDYNDLLNRFLIAEQPADDVERELVAKMVRHTWLSERAIRLQEACFLFPPQSPEQKAIDRQSMAVMKDIDVYLRYQAHHDRAYQRAASELAKRRKDRNLAVRGFESQKRAEAEAARQEERQTERRELHPYRIATAQWQQERRQLRTAVTKVPQQARSAAAIGTPSPQTGEIAACSATPFRRLSPVSEAE